MKKSIKAGINSFQLKCLGIVFMTIDHIGAYINPIMGISFLRIAGRIAAPLFLYVLINSVSHTKNKLRFALRLYVAHIIIGIVSFALTIVGEKWFGANEQFSILSTFSYTVLFIWIIEKMSWGSVEGVSKKRLLGYWILLVAIIVLPIAGLFFNQLEITLQIFLPNVLTVPYSPIFILMGICWYFGKSKKSQMVVLVVFSCLSFVGNKVIAGLNTWIWMDFFSNTQFFMILFLPFICLYNGKRGKPIKYFFYAYYPIHIYICILIGSVLAK